MEIKDIIEKDFGKALIGYNCKEVDFFLDEIIDQMERYEKNQKEMLTALEYLLNELEKFETEDKSEKKNKTEKKNGIRQKVQSTADTIRKNIESAKHSDYTVPVYTDAAEEKEDPVIKENTTTASAPKEEEKVQVSEEHHENEEKEEKDETMVHIPVPEFLKIKNTVSNNKKTMRDDLLEDTFNELQKELDKEKESK